MSLSNVERIKKYIENLIDSNNYHGIDKEKIYDDLKIMISDKMDIEKIKETLIQICSGKNIYHLDYEKIARDICVEKLHSKTSDSILEYIESIRNVPLSNNKGTYHIINEKTYNIIKNNYQLINGHIDYQRDYKHTFFGINTLIRSYLIKINNKVVERPQHLFMRVAIGIHGEDFKSAFKTYDLLSTLKCTHASPTLFNCGTINPQCSSCFLVAVKDDSIEGIFDTYKECASISKLGGGIGVHISNLRANNSLIRGTNGKSQGILPVLKVFNEVAEYVDQGGGKRKGAFAIYMEPHHPDIISFIRAKTPSSSESSRADKLFYSVYISDLFMERVKNNQIWSLFCPSESGVDLSNYYGDEYRKKYLQLEREKKYSQQVMARNIWEEICKCLIETGVPYIVFKDHVNKKSNQNNLGIIKSSNLCAEIVQYSNKDETSVCNLASICLSQIVKDKKIDYDILKDITQTLVRNLDKIIDINKYPTINTKRSNLKHRPMGIGVQGLADLFFKLDLSFSSSQALTINKEVFEHIYFYALEESIKIAKERQKTFLKDKYLLKKTVDKIIRTQKDFKIGKHNINYYEALMIRKFMDQEKYLGAYSSIEGSHFSKGQFQFNLWKNYQLSIDSTKWEKLSEMAQKYGTRNSQLTACMPTASTSQIMGNNECIEPFTENIYKRRTLSGQFFVVNKYMLKDLEALNLLNDKIIKKIVDNNGSLSDISEIPQNIKEKYLTSYEISNKILVKMAADRGPFIDQSQSLNIYKANPSFDIITQQLFDAHRKGLKTGIYYLRSRAAVKTRSYDSKIKVKEQKEKEECLLCSA